jgi:anti-sigma B factor antagonist
MISTELTIRGPDGQVVVALRGELDLSDAGDVAAALTAVAGPEPRIVVDLSGMAFIDWAGAQALARGREMAREADGDLLIAASQEQVVRMLTRTALTPGLSLYASPEEAIRHLGGSGAVVVLSARQLREGADGPVYEASGVAAGH